MLCLYHERPLAVLGSSIWPTWSACNITKTPGHYATQTSHICSCLRWWHGAALLLLVGPPVPPGRRPEKAPEGCSNSKKSHLRLTGAQYLGYRIGQGLLKPTTKKEHPRPTSKKQVHAFFWLAGYYHRFVPYFSSLAAPTVSVLIPLPGKSDTVYI